MMLPYLLLLLAAANASAYSLQTSGHRRTQLLESYLNGPVPEPQPVVVPLSPHRRSLLQANVTSAQSLAAQDSPVQPKRAFKMAFYNKLDDSRSKSDQDYIMKELIPATAALLARSIRVCPPRTTPIHCAECADATVPRLLRTTHRHMPCQRACNWP